MTKGILGAVIATASLFAAQPEKNLERYVESLLENSVDLNCTVQTPQVICRAKAATFTDTDAEGNTVIVHYDVFAVRFASQTLKGFESPSYDQAVKALQAYNERQTKFGPMGAGPRPDTLGRILFNGLQTLRVDNVAIGSQQESMMVDQIVLENNLSRAQSGMTYDNRALGTVRLSYRGLHSNVTTNKSTYREMLSMLDTLLGSSDTTRSRYVADALYTLYQSHIGAMSSGTTTLQLAPIGNDVVTVTLSGEAGTAKGDHTQVRFEGEIVNASVLFNDEQNLSRPVMPDFIFRSLQASGHSDATSYRDALKKDPKLTAYISAYEAEITKRVNTAVAELPIHPTVKGWLENFKAAFSKSLLGDADRFEMVIRNKTGVAASQIAGLVIAQMMAAPNEPGVSATDPSALIQAMVAQHLEITFTAK